MLSSNQALKFLVLGWLLIELTTCCKAQSGEASDPPKTEASGEVQADSAANFQRDQLVAWCIVPFDSAKRGPEQRATMLVDLGMTRCAYDWREEHVQSFEEEFLQYQKHGIELFAFWGMHQEAFRLFQKYDLHPQIWWTLGDPGGDLKDRARRAAESLEPIARQTAELGLTLGLYNHGGWGGEPENMVQVCRELRAAGHEHVGIVYNFHHAHDRISDWPESLQQMLPYLLCINLNGMNAQAQPKILALGEGQYETQMIQAIMDSGYAGPIGIIDHQEHRDTREVLQENLSGLQGIVEKLRRRENLQPQANSDELSDNTLDPRQVESLAEEARRFGNADRGAAVFGSDQWGCVSCHAVPHSSLGSLGGDVGPNLVHVLPTRSATQIVESLFWPQREVAPEFQLWQVLTFDGTVHSGFQHSADSDSMVLRDIAQGGLKRIAREDIDSLSQGGSPMPDGLLARMTRMQQLDLVQFLMEIGRTKRITDDQLVVIADSYQHGPASFEVRRQPVQPSSWPHHQEHVNRDRIYDYYSKQAEYFRQRKISPLLLPAFPGLDGGNQGHWGNQNEQTWADDRWNETLLSRVQSGVLRHQGLTVTRGICVQLGEPTSLYCCFDPDTLSYPAIWQGGFVQFSSVRHGLLDGLRIRGQWIGSQTSPLSGTTQDSDPSAQRRFLGFYRVGQRIVFAYRIGSQVYLDSPRVENGQFVNEVAPIQSHSMRNWVLDPEGVPWPTQWPNRWSTAITTQQNGALEIDTIHIPFDNEWKAKFLIGGHDFLPDGSAMVCTIQGDVWHVDGLEPGSKQANWRRFAAGLHQPLGLWIDQDGIFVQCRDQLVRLKDLNRDGEADFYECFSMAMISSPAGHDFICGLQRDSSGNFYTASGNQGLVQIAPDGQTVRVLANGFRNPDGLGLMPDGRITVPCSEGDWTPASMVCLVDAVPSFSQTDLQSTGTASPVSFFGHGGPREDGPQPQLPLVYLPRGLDNSSGDQTMVPPGLWGPLTGQCLHLSFGAGSWFALLRDTVNGQHQGGVVPLAGEFLSGVHRGRFHPTDGSFYVSGMGGWGTYTKEDGCFQRVRLTNQSIQQPVGFHVHRNGILIQFAQPLDVEVASRIRSHFAQAWNYRYSGAYGSPEFSPSHPGVAGHDWMAITEACVVDRHSLFLEILDLQPVSQLHLRMHVNRSGTYPTLNPTGEGHDLFLTVHRLDEDFTDYPAYRPYAKTVMKHPMERDLASRRDSRKNPWLEAAGDSARAIELKTGKNLSYESKEIRVRAGEMLQLTLINADVVPHNWVLAQPGSLPAVGELVNRIITDPDAYWKQYIPETDAILVYTDVVAGGQQQTIHFRAPTVPGRYPYLCTFPGHWMVMNGVLQVEP